MTWKVDSGEEARLTPAGPHAARIESRGSLPLRVRSTLGLAAGGRAHPGTAVVLGDRTFEVVGEEAPSPGSVVYLLDPWPRDQTIRDRVSYGARIVRTAQQERKRRRREPVAAALRLPLALLAALLPEPERAALAARWALNVLRGSLLLAALQVLGAGIAWPVGLIQFFRDREAQVAGQIRREEREITQRDIAEAQLYSRMGVLLYLLSPGSLALLYVGATGFARWLNLRLNGQPLGDPMLSALLGLWRVARRRGARAARLEALGPERPDRVIAEGADLVVLSAREKPLWNQRATIQVGDVFYRLRDVGERQDGRFRALAYRLSPVEPGTVFRSLVRYDLMAAQRDEARVGDEGTTPHPRTTAEMAPSPPAAADRAPALAISVPPPAAREARGESHAMAGAAHAAGPSADAFDRPDDARPRADDAAQLLRVDQGEEARLTPDGPYAAVLESLGALPLRPRSSALGVHHRPEFPGTCVRIGSRRFEVVEEQALELGFRYCLDPWPPEHVPRGIVEYGPALVAAAQRERESAVTRERAAWYAPALAPLLGLLPEPRQAMACERYGLDASDATLAGAALEVVLASVLIGAFSPLSLVLAVPLGFGVILPALLRGLGALAWGEVSGSALLGLVENLRSPAAGAPRRFDPTVLPITRDAFWARLALADRHERLPDGGLLVRSLLPHLTWAEPGAGERGQRALRLGGEHWQAAALPPVVERGRLTYAYRLDALRAPGTLAEPSTPPDPRHYQDEVLEGVAREWDDLFRSAPWLPCLLSAAVQERAHRQRGGVAAARRFTLITAAAEALLGVWFLAGRGPANAATGIFFAVEAGVRAWLCLHERFAPSVLGWPFGDILRPERVAYHAHRDAEREARSALRRAEEQSV